MARFLDYLHVRQRTCQKHEQELDLQQQLHDVEDLQYICSSVRCAALLSLPHSCHSGRILELLCDDFRVLDIFGRQVRLAGPVEDQ